MIHLQVTMTEMVEIPPGAQAVMAALSRGPQTVTSLTAALHLSEHTVRYHLRRLLARGLIQKHLRAPVSQAGRPAAEYTVTARATGLFPKRYLELLDALLAAAQAEGLQERLMARVTQDMVAPLQVHLGDLSGEARLLRLLELLDYGDLLPDVRAVPGGLCLEAFNCVYVGAGLHHEVICDLLPRVLSGASGTPVERLRCQRDGGVTCEFMARLP